MHLQCYMRHTRHPKRHTISYRLVLLVTRYCRRCVTSCIHRHMNHSITITLIWYERIQSVLFLFGVRETSIEHVSLWKKEQCIQTFSFCTILSLFKYYWSRLIQVARFMTVILVILSRNPKTTWKMGKQTSLRIGWTGLNFSFLLFYKLQTANVEW